MSGCRKPIPPASTVTMSLRSAAAKAAAVNPWPARARPITTGLFDRVAARRITALRQSSGSAAAIRAYACSRVECPSSKPSSCDRASSSNASGFPAAPLTAPSSDPGLRPRLSRTSRDSSAVSGRSERAGMPSSPFWRVAISTAMRSAPIRRAAKVIASLDAASSHCASSTSTSSGRRLAAAHSRLNAPTSTASRSASRVAPMASALRTAFACRSGSSGRRSVSGVSRSTRPANGSEVSVSTPRARTICISPA